MLRKGSYLKISVWESTLILKTFRGLPAPCEPALGMKDPAEQQSLCACVLHGVAHVLRHRQPGTQTWHRQHPAGTAYAELPTRGDTASRHGEQPRARHGSAERSSPAPC